MPEFKNREEYEKWKEERMHKATDLVSEPVASKPGPEPPAPKHSKGNSVCTTCHFIGNPKKITKGSFFIELILYLFMIVPGLIYSIWRLTTKQLVCPACKNPTMIPITTPVGKELIEKISQSSVAG
jgi:hypothetical protein